MSRIKIGKVALNPKGNWVSTTTYEKLDMVISGGKTFVARDNVPVGTTTSTTTYWQQMVNSFESVTTTTVSASTEASASIIGTPDKPILSLQIPRGVSGNESIDDSAGAGDNDVVWSADKSWNEDKAIKNIFISHNNMQDEDLWGYGGLTIGNGIVDTTNHKRICSEWVRVSPGSTLSTSNSYKYSYIVSSQPQEAATYKLENKSLGTGSSTITHEGYIRICVAPPTETEDTDISIRENLVADIVQNEVSENTLDIEHLNNKVEQVENGLLNFQNDQLYFEIIKEHYINHNTGEAVPYASYDMTGLIPVSNLDSVMVTKANSSYNNCFYNSSKERISNFTTPSGTNRIAIPSGAYYMALSDSKAGMEATTITAVTKEKAQFFKTPKAVFVDNPFYMKRYIGNTVIGEALTVGGAFFRFDAITVKTKDSTEYTANWSQFLTDLADIFGANENINAPIVAYDYTTNCARLFKNVYLLYDLDTQKFVCVYKTSALTPTQVVLFGIDNQNTACGPVYEQYKFTHKQGLACYMDDFVDVEESVLDDKADFRFTFATDCHFYFDDYSGYHNPTNEVIQRIDDCLHVDAIINGGDSVIHGSKNRAYAIGAYNQVFERLAQDKVIYCMGNHDWNGVSSISSQQDKDWSLDNTSTDNLFMTHNRDAVFPSGNGVKYFYRDFDDKKIRVIVLNTSDIDISFTNDIIDIDPLMVLGIRQAQLTWLTDTALVVPNDDWHILVIMHGGLYLNADGFPGNTTVINKDSVIEILSAFVDKTTYSYSGTDSTYDGYFTVSGSGTFASAHGSLIGVFSGHAHADGYCNKDGFNAIQTECSYLDYDQKPGRIVRTIDEVAIDCVSINKTDKTIKIKRFGYGNNRNYTY